ncbi:MAG TPA: glycosyl hydrolase [Ktedonobacteraceae bacterium]
MIKLYIATDEAVAVVRQHNGEWIAGVQMVGSHPQCLAIDSLHPQQVYCGTFDRGLWRSQDAGETWEQVGPGIEHESVTAVAVSTTERAGHSAVVYAGTEPSTLYRSEDGGNTWQELSALRRLPSAPTWSFPPRPYTSHVRWITPDPLVAGRVFAAIEAGALVRSLDGGQTWEDRKASGPYDTHTLIMHRLAPNRLYSAAGDGFMQPGNGFVESDDGGEIWYRSGEGLQHHYLWSVATDPDDPTILVISAAHGPQQAHNPQSAESAIYRRSGDSQWRRVRDGFPEPRGLLTSVLATHAAEPGVFYAANNRGVFRSADAGSSWEAMPIRWSQDLRFGRAHALVVVQE